MLPASMSLRHAALVLPVLAACAATPAPPPPVEPPPAASAAPAAAASLPGPCAALDGPLRTLRRLSAVVSLGRSMPVRPLQPELFAAQVAGEAAAAHATVVRDDPGLTKLAGDAGARLDKIAAAARAYVAAKGSEAARAALLDEMERGEMVTLLADERCDKGAGVAPKHSAAALESGIGRISLADLSRAVRAGADAFKRCHEAGLRRDPSLRGVVRVRFEIARDGTVREAADADRGPADPLAWGTGAGASAVRDPEVSACVVAAFQKLSFPKPQGGGAFGATYAVELGALP
jgi:hypothetical protein